MSDNDHFDTKAKELVEEALKSYYEQYHRAKCYLGLIFQQGQRQMIQINVPAHDLPILLQAKPSVGNDPDSGKNRPEVKGHAEEIKEYIRQRVKKGKPWILGTLTANVDPEKLEIKKLSRGMCFVIIKRGVRLDITDGQHRKRAIHELIESAESELVADNDFPITLVLEKDFNQCQADFRDMAQSRQLDKSLLLSFGEFEGRVGITKYLLGQVPIFVDKTEKVKSNPETKKKLIYTTNYIAKTVSFAFSGESSNDLRELNVEESGNALAECLNQFFSECQQTRHIHEKEFDDLTIEEVASFKEKCLLARSVGLEILGRLLFSAYNSIDNYFLPDKISQLAQLDWSRESKLWEGNVVLADYNEQNSTTSYRITASANAVRMAVSVVKLKLGW